MTQARSSWAMWALLAAAALFATGCVGGGTDDDDGDGGSGGEGGSGGAAGGMVADAGAAGAGGEAGGAGGEAGAGGAGGAGGEGGMMMPERPIDQRCPDGQTGTFLLVMFPDRVDAYRQRDFGAGYFCEFLALADNGITDATGMVMNRDGDTFYVVQPEDGKGSVYAFSANGEFIRKVATNVNLEGVDGIWNTFGDRFVVWSATSSNLHELDSDGSYRTLYSPPVAPGSRVTHVTDMLFLDQDSVLATFSNRPAQLFKEPFAPTWPDDQVGPGNAIEGVTTEDGIKILMSAQVGGEGNGYGIMLYEPAFSGRAPPELERILVNAAEDVVDGIDIVGLPAGFLVLNSNLAGTANIVSYNSEGELQQNIALEGGGNPVMMMPARIFPDF